MQVTPSEFKVIWILSLKTWNFWSASLKFGIYLFIFLVLPSKSRYK